MEILFKKLEFNVKINSFMAKIEVNSILILFVKQKFPDGIKYTFNKHLCIIL